ncbi:hypothetical protein PMAYCL1PPCAC_26971, partial [Pristionchus mayeri]
DCNYETTRIGNLDRHLQTEHGFTAEAIDGLRKKRREEKGAARLKDETNLPEVCPACEKRFASKESLRKHVSRFHKEDKPGAATNVRCPVEDCAVDGLRSREELAEHCRMDHSEAGEFEVIER